MLADLAFHESPQIGTSTVEEPERKTKEMVETRESLECDDELMKKMIVDKLGGGDRSKFKKVKMPIFEGSDPDSWIFCADRYFQIHQLSEAEKLNVAVISFEGEAIEWYRAMEECKPFEGWPDLKERLLSARDDSVCGQFMAIKQDSRVVAYWQKFFRLVALHTHLTNEVLENIFMNELNLVIKDEV